MDRNAIDEKYKWDLTQIFKSTEEFEECYKKAETLIEDFKKYENIMGENAKKFYETINTYYEISRVLDKLYTYTSLLSDTDTSNNTYQSLKIKVSNLLDKWSKASFFITPTILKKEYPEIEKYYEEEPKLKDYEIILKREFRYKEHTLSDEEEKLLSNLTKMLNNNYQTYELLKDSDLTFGTILDEAQKEVVLTESNYSIYIESKDRRVRKDAFKTLYQTYKQFINSFASTLSGNINENITIAKIKKYNSTIEWCLYHDELDETIYTNLINTVSNNMNILYKYYSLKKEILNLDELHLYDIYTPIVKDFNKDYPYEEAKETVLKALSILGEDYISTLTKGLENNWVDVYPSPSKRTGGYSGGSYDTAPYILLNYQEKYNDMSTLAHEAGHSMHSYYTRKNNSYQYGDYSIFVAEVASTTNEILLAKYLLKTSNNKEEKLFILDNLMNLFKATIYRQTMFAEFEQAIYKDAENDIPLTADYLSEKYYTLNQKYFGSDVVIEKEIQYEWARIPHFYYNFYVYKYATGLSAACHIANDILSGKENAVENYKSFLKCGSKKNPIDSLKLAGVDLTKKEVVESAINMFNDTIDEFKNLTEE
ncbi:MAG: oligoendopeptidase F [Bacilli bacterium]|nr:oligoendopeptidase F [Bacilli bacterium]